MTRESKKPEERRQELLDVAFSLFSKKGYEGVSVRDILREVEGTPGMFYYYFKSKEEIYLAMLAQYMEKSRERKDRILEAEDLPFEEKVILFRKQIQKDIQGYAEHFPFEEGASISDVSYKLYDFMQMLSRMVEPYAQLICQGAKEKKLNLPEPSLEEAEALASFVLFGCWGMLYRKKVTGLGKDYGLEEIVKVAERMFYK